jgi:hypothetical protein
LIPVHAFIMPGLTIGFVFSMHEFLWNHQLLG